MIIFVVLTAVISIPFLYRNRQVNQQSTNLEPTKVPKRPLTEEGQDMDQEYRMLNYFKQEVLPQHSTLANELQNQNIRRVTSIDYNGWIIEVLDQARTRAAYKPKPEITRSIVENRHLYLLTDNYWKKITEDESLRCYVGEARIVEHETGLPIDSPLKEDMLIITGPCNGEDSFVSLYKLNSGEKVRFKDPNNLIANRVPYKWLERTIIADSGNVTGLLTPGVFGKEPVIVVDFVKNDRFNPSQGIGVFSVRTGNLLDLVMYNSF